jgi:hypothetical protein
MNDGVPARTLAPFYASTLWAAEDSEIT